MSHCTDTFIGSRHGRLGYGKHTSDRICPRRRSVGVLANPFGYRRRNFYLQLDIAYKSNGHD